MYINDVHIHTVVIMCKVSCVYDFYTLFLYSNIAEALISKGLAYCLRHKQDDDQRSSQYDELMAAEARYMYIRHPVE